MKLMKGRTDTCKIMCIQWNTDMSLSLTEQIKGGKQEHIHIKFCSDAQCDRLQECNNSEQQSGTKQKLQKHYILIDY